MGLTLKIMIALLSTLGSAAKVTGRPRSTKGTGDPAATDSPQGADTVTITEYQDPVTTSFPEDTFTSIIDADGTEDLTTTVILPLTTSSSIASSQVSCPFGQASYFYNSRIYCCPGTFYGLGASAFCGVCCTGASADPTTVAPSDLSCLSIIWIAYDEYDAKVALAISQGDAFKITPGSAMGVSVAAAGFLLAV